MTVVLVSSLQCQQLWTYSANSFTPARRQTKLSRRRKSVRCRQSRDSQMSTCPTTSIFGIVSDTLLLFQDTNDQGCLPTTVQSTDPGWTTPSVSSSMVSPERHFNTNRSRKLLCMPRQRYTTNMTLGRVMLWSHSARTAFNTQLRSGVSSDWVVLSVVPRQHME